MKRPYREVTVAGGNICLTRFDSTLNPSVMFRRDTTSNFQQTLFYISQSEARYLANELLALLDDDKDEE